MIVVGIACLVAECIGGQEPSTLHRQVTIEGLVVAYDWFLHATSSRDALVVRATARDGKTVDYIRLIYGSLPHDAPPSAHPPRLNPLAFVGAGRPWVFFIRDPRTSQEVRDCSVIEADHTYEDASGIGKIPRFVRTPGVEDDEHVPPVETLRCHVLERLEQVELKGRPERPSDDWWRTAVLVVEEEASFPIIDGRIRGRIVAYDWLSRRISEADEFVVRVADDEGKPMGYVRVIYNSFPNDAPLSEYGPRIDPLAFVGTGQPWTFVIRKPLTSQERFSCSRIMLEHPVEDGNRKGALPRFVRTPGAESESLPPFERLPCYVLEKGAFCPPQVE